MQRVMRGNGLGDKGIGGKRALCHSRAPLYPFRAGGNLQKFQRRDPQNSKCEI